MAGLSYRVLLFSGSHVMRRWCLEVTLFSSVPITPPQHPYFFLLPLQIEHSPFGFSHTRLFFPLDFFFTSHSSLAFAEGCTFFFFRRCFLDSSLAPGSNARVVSIPSPANPPDSFFEEFRPPAQSWPSCSNVSSRINPTPLSGTKGFDWEALPLLSDNWFVPSPRSGHWDAWCRVVTLPPCGFPSPLPDCRFFSRQIP